MASYRLLYQSREQVAEHNWSAVYIPCLLVLLVVYALFTPSNDPANPEFANGAVVELLTVFGAILLAWHYTGQAWGMTASFAFMQGVRFEKSERTLIRSGFYALMVFHVSWALFHGARSTQTPFFSSLLTPQLVWINFAFHVSILAAALCIPLGLWGILKVRSRTGHWPPMRSIVPWVAAYFWYVLIWWFPGMFLCLQVFHALQYLTFPLRVEVNRKSEIDSGQRTKDQPSWMYGGVVYLILTVVGAFVFWAPRAAIYLGDTSYVLAAMVAAVVNIHHYFIDGAIWKIRNPRVRRDLFSHLRTET